MQTVHWVFGRKKHSKYQQENESVLLEFTNIINANMWRESTGYRLNTHNIFPQIVVSSHLRLDLPVSRMNKYIDQI